MSFPVIRPMRIFTKILRGFVLLVLAPCILFAEPIVLTGKMVPELLGKKISSLRVTDRAGVGIPFQIDQVTGDDYVCPSGKEPNAGSGLLDTADEISFLWEDAEPVPTIRGDVSARESARPKNGIAISLSHGLETRQVCIVENPTGPLSPVSYITYDDTRELITTPYYYASFGHNRFHFTRAGIKDFSGAGYLNVTNELRVRIFLKALWGLLPIQYTEENMICFVKRYKVGPIRCIRRGDFHLNLGLFLQGSHAAVNQICYPQMVRVPVYVHLPVRFSTLFSEAFVEMTPVLRKEAADFSFAVPERGLSFALNADKKIDTLISANPNHTCMIVGNKKSGYGWLLDANMDKSPLTGSGYRIIIPSKGGGAGQCGFRLALRELPKGYYLIGNWVLFSRDGEAGLLESCNVLSNMAVLTTPSNVRYNNQLAKIFAFRKR